METLRFKNDSAKRKRLFVAGAMSHPAKGHISMWEEMVLRYSKEGDWCLDPMAGIGTSLVAALLGRNLICVELEPHFVEPMRASWAKMQQHPMLGYTMGQAIIIRGDARCLPMGSADAIVTSPPYQEVTAEGGFEYIARMKREGRFTGTSTGISGKGQPWEERSAQKLPIATENIGNLRGQAYWTAQAAVYAECWRVLKPGGIMALVLGNFVRDGLIVDLVGDTITMCESLGFRKVDHWQRVKWSLSFWRILQVRKGGPVIDREDVVAFRKPYPGSGSEASLTERGISPLEPSHPVQWVFTSGKLTSDPSPQLPLSLPIGE